ncbi:regulator of G-protein signaling 14 [Lepeophtheirus salmonis]|uniref:regulator of G-protein signaling 14 n=1 Tax=Lepeophtheirus salmonis TaxID=72036 RepID=UPI001AE3AC87|nr:regulator of G-protein signaling loco-like [Lepeophtheirus salmonis]
MLSKIDLNGSEELQVTQSSIQSLIHNQKEDEVGEEKMKKEHAREEALNEWVAGYLGTAEIPLSESSVVRNYIRRLRSDKRRVHSSVRFIVYKDRIRLLHHRKGSLFAEFYFKDLSFASVSPDDTKIFALVITKPRTGASCHVFSLSSPSLPLVNLLQSLYSSSDDSFNTEQLEQLNTAQNLRQSVLKYLPYSHNGKKEEKPYNFLECCDTLDGLLPLAKQGLNSSKSLEELGQRFMDTEKESKSKMNSNILKPTDLYPMETNGLKTSSSQAILRSNGVVDLHAKKGREGIEMGRRLVENNHVKPTQSYTRIQNWAQDFEILLEDPLGFQLFSDFLKTEFSHENIAFWKECEQYRTTTELPNRKKMAESIVEHYLDPGAPDPVNVDSEAKSFTQKFLSQSSPDLFVQAQRQIFNLMKYDSFRRFVLSDVYKECLDAEANGKDLPEPKKDALNNSSILQECINQENKKSKNLNYARRKSLLPFSFKHSNSNTQSKMNSKEQSSESKKSSQEGSTNTKSSKTSKEETDGILVRLILPDKATTVVQVRTGESIRSMVARLLEKRGLYFTSFDAFITNSDKPLNLSTDSASIGTQEVRVEPRNLFRIELPSKKSIGVKAKPTKRIYEVLGPILLQYGWNLACVVVKLENHLTKLHSDIDLNDYVSSIDNTRLVISNRMDEISPKLLEELLIDKSNF